MKRFMKQKITLAVVAAALSFAPFAGVPNFVPLAQAQTQSLPDVADLADKLLPAVVEITLETKVGGRDAPAQELPKLPDDSPFKDFFDDFLKKRQGGGDSLKDRTFTSAGSGFVIDASGLIVTNNHVVENSESIKIHFQDDTVLTGEIIGRDPKVDLAVVRVKPSKPLPTVNFGDSDKLRIGNWVMVIGNPFGMGTSLSLGVVSARNRSINMGPYDDFIQTDAAINKGNSGGPLFNLAGEVVGINTAIYSPSGVSAGIGFSVPANTAKSVVNQLIKFGETRRGWLGVRVQQITPELDESMELKGIKGALVADVTPDSPGGKAGIQAGDVVIEFDGRPIREMKALPRAVSETEVGKKVGVKVNRKGQELAFTVELGRLEDAEKKLAQGAPSTNPSATVTALGLTASNLTKELREKFKLDEKIKGAVITEVAKDSLAEEKRLEPGDVVIEAGSRQVEAASDITDAITAAEKEGKSAVLLLVAKGGKEGETRFIALKLKK